MVFLDDSFPGTYLEDGRVVRPAGRTLCSSSWPGSVTRRPQKATTRERLGRKVRTPPARPAPRQHQKQDPGACTAGDTDPDACDDPDVVLADPAVAQCQDR